MANTIQFRRDTAANWTSADPTLAAGEFGYETDTLKVKIGDGATAWSSLAYALGADTLDIVLGRGDTSASNDITLTSGTLTANTITDGTATLTGGNLTTTGSITTNSLTDNTATLTGGVLNGLTDINATATTDLTLFGTSDVANDTDGKSFYVYRKAAEGDGNLQFYLDQFGTGYINFNGYNNTRALTIQNVVGGDINIQTTNNGYIKLDPFANSAGVTLFESAGSGENKLLRQAGYITAASTRKYIQYQINDTTDNYELTREDTNIGNFDIQMPLVVDSISNPDAVLSLNPDAAQNVELFNTTDVGDASDGKALVVKRQAAEGDSYISLNCDQYTAGNLFTSADMVLSAATGSNTMYMFASNFDLNQYGNSANGTWRLWGNLTDIGAKRYIQLQVNDGNDAFEITRQDTNIDYMDIQMPLITDLITSSGGIIFPSADPHVAGAWWDKAGTLTKSSG